MTGLTVTVHTIGKITTKKYAKNIIGRVLHRPDGHKPKCTEFVLSCAGRKFHLVASFRSIGAVNLLLAPQCLIVNQLELPLFLKLTKEREKSCLSVEKSSVFPFALEEVILRMQIIERFTQICHSLGSVRSWYRGD